MDVELNNIIMAISEDLATVTVKVKAECENCLMDDGKNCKHCLHSDTSYEVPLKTITDAYGTHVDACSVRDEEADNTGRLDSYNEVICVDNTGIDDRFDIGTTYLSKPKTILNPGDEGMICVCDKFGNSDEYRMERFKFVESEETKGTWKARETERMSK